MNKRETARALYKKLLALYPREFREELGESMQQTFNDLYRERQKEHRLFGFLFWMFAETSGGIIREHILLHVDRGSMKAILSNPRSAAMTSLILAMPLGLTFVAFMFDIQPLTKPLNSLLTTAGQPGEINMLGRIVIYGGLLLLPVAFVVNLRPMLKREAPEGKRRLHTINLIASAIILLLILFTWGGLFLEEIDCLRGIRCD